MDKKLILNVKDNQLVLFADIIGFKNIILNNEKTTMTDKDALLINFPLMNEDFNYKYSEERQKDIGLRILWVSDSIMISSAIDNADIFFTTILDIYNSLLVCHLALRGAIALGNVYHDKNIWGSAYIEAVETEGKYAVYPRIIVKSSTMDLVKTIYKDFFTVTETPGYMQLNFFDYYFHRVLEKGVNIIANISVYVNFIYQSYMEAKKPEHIEKHVWMAYELSMAISKYGSQIDKYVSENEKHANIPGLGTTRICSHEQLLKPLSKLVIRKVPS